jgi:hypothetical protein
MGAARETTDPGERLTEKPPVTAVGGAPGAKQLASQIGNRAFGALVRQRALGRWPNDDELDVLGSRRRSSGLIPRGSTADLHEAIYGDSSLAHAPMGPNRDIRWEREATRLNALPDADLARELAGLDQDSLRLLDDGAQRVLGSGDSRLRTAVRNRLIALGVPAARAGTGMRYGTVRATVGTIVHGDAAAGTNWEYPIELWFEPVAALVDADEIGWIQTVRNVDTVTGANRSPFGTRRMAPDWTKVDRLTGRQQGWYGMSDAQTGGATMRLWTKGGTETAAYMTDTPSFPDGNRDFHFEAAAVARKGPDVGKVYAVVTWGFTVDAALHVTAKPTRIFNRETVGFDRAVELWNEQARLPNAADRNAPGQVELPTPR